MKARQIPPLPDLERLVEDFVMSLPCRDQSPYPPVEVTAPNEGFARLLLDAFADGPAAELTAVTQYIHHHLTIPDHRVARLELCIALVEMFHLGMIGELIEKLGLDPRYWRTNKAWWQGGEVAYGTDLCDQLLRDIESEKAAINAYLRLIGEIDDPKVRRVLERIVGDEQVHLMLFRQAFAAIC